MPRLCAMQLAMQGYLNVERDTNMPLQLQCRSIVSLQVQSVCLVRTGYVFCGIIVTVALQPFFQPTYQVQLIQYDRSHSLASPNIGNNHYSTKMLHEDYS